MKLHTPWIICPRPYFNELLSSYLVRIAHANGKSPSRFCAFYFPGIPIWNRDIDRSATASFIQSVAWNSQVSETVIRDMTLQAWENNLIPMSSNIQHALVSWINVLGIYHHSRNRHGMQYCPNCLTEADFYQKNWRLSFVTVCPKHTCSLLDCCTHCLAPISFHRNEALHLHCYNCGRTLIHPIKHTGNHSEFQTRLMLQEQLLTVLNDGKSIIADNTISSHAYLVGLSLLLRAIKTRLRTMRNSHQLLLPIDCSSGQMERIRLNERVQQCLILAKLLDNWPTRFLKLAADMQMTQRVFDTGIALPEWLEKTVIHLPTGKVRTHQKNTSPIRQKIRQIHRHKTTGWRTKRAKLLLKIAGIHK